MVILTTEIRLQYHLNSVVACRTMSYLLGKSGLEASYNEASAAEILKLIYVYPSYLLFQGSA